jgi:hypothetical protein
MIWWFLILGLSGIVVLWVGTTLFLRMRQRFRQTISKGSVTDADHEQEQGQV